MELEDLPDMVAMIETDLKRQITRILANGIRDEDSFWDEYDEIWGFDDAPRGFEDYEVHVQARLDRVRGIPTQIQAEDLGALYTRVEKRRRSRIARGITP